MNASWRNAKTHQPLQVPDGSRFQGRRPGVHWAQLPMDTSPAVLPTLVTMQVTGSELRSAVRLVPVGPYADVASQGHEFACEAGSDDTAGIPRWRVRRIPVAPSRRARREPASPAPADETGDPGADARMSGHLLWVAFCDHECRTSAGEEPCRDGDVDSKQRRDVPGECGPDTEGDVFACGAHAAADMVVPADCSGTMLLPVIPVGGGLGEVLRHGQPCRTCPPAAPGRPVPPKDGASRRVTLPQGPAAGGTLPCAVAQAGHAPEERQEDARGSRTPGAAGAPAPSAVAQEQAARIAEAGMKAEAEAWRVLGNGLFDRAGICVAVARAIRQGHTPSGQRNFIRDLTEAFGPKTAGDVPQDLRPALSALNRCLDAVADGIQEQAADPAWRAQQTARLAGCLEALAEHLSAAPARPRLLHPAQPPRLGGSAAAVARTPTLTDPAAPPAPMPITPDHGTAAQNVHQDEPHTPATDTMDTSATPQPSPPSAPVSPPAPSAVPDFLYRAGV
ncbi:hypothetical protein [Streptomyces hygroscopicus]|uniref:hypothetical protein n=1 Tax=Streptomyces hygroscopicus TaxID=1912 RepID=UPI00223EE248|nr:hypothetical protein [Streptomyces hygroscopicus]